MSDSFSHKEGVFSIKSEKSVSINLQSIKLVQHKVYSDHIFTANLIISLGL